MQDSDQSNEEEEFLEHNIMMQSINMKNNYSEMKNENILFQNDDDV